MISYRNRIVEAYYKRYRAEAEKNPNIPPMMYTEWLEMCFLLYIPKDPNMLPTQKEMDHDPTMAK